MGTTEHGRGARAGAACATHSGVILLYVCQSQHTPGRWGSLLATCAIKRSKNCRPDITRPECLASERRALSTSAAMHGRPAAMPGVMQRSYVCRTWITSLAALVTNQCCYRHGRCLRSLDNIHLYHVPGRPLQSRSPHTHTGELPTTRPSGILTDPCPSRLCAH